MKDELIVNYELIEGTLTISYVVLVDYPYMIGGHPAFNIDGLPSEIKLSNSEYFLLRDGIIDKTKPYQLVGGSLEISKSTFQNDALVFNNDYALNQVMLNRDLVMTYEVSSWEFWHMKGLHLRVWRRGGCRKLIINLSINILS